MVISITVNAGERERIDFPINPESIETTDGVENTSVNVSNLGEIILKGKRNLTTISWSAFFPREDYDFCVATPLDDPNEYVEKIKDWMDNNYTVTLDIPGFISLNCLITSFEPSPNGGIYDIGYNISFKQFKDVDLPSVKKQTAKRPVKAVVAHLYKWKNNDTWKKVAKKETGDSKNSKKLRKLNEKRIKKATKKYRDKHHVTTVKEKVALVGEKVLIK